MASRIGANTGRGDEPASLVAARQLVGDARARRESPLERRRSSRRTHPSAHRDTRLMRPGPYAEVMRVLIAEDEPYLADAIRDGLRLEAIAADVVNDGDAALEALSVNAYDVLVLDRDLPGTSGDDVAAQVVADALPCRILMLTAADRLEDKVRGFELGADDYLTKPFAMRELVVRLRALGRRPVDATPPVVELAGLALDPFRREVYRDGRYVGLTRKQFAVLEVLMGAGGGVVSAETLLERAWDEHADPFTNAVRITISSLRKRLGDPWLIHTVAGAGYRVGLPPHDPARPPADQR